MKASVVALLGLAISTCTSAHKCNDGKGLTCMAVEALAMDKDNSNNGLSARGTPHCTADKQKVYCLIDHNYHRCQGGSSPCCQDGSNPWHAHHGAAAASDDFTCKVATQAPVAAMAVKQAPVQVILDDMDKTLNLEMANVHEGSYAPCMKDAYKKQFHHDWGQNKGRAKFSFTFEPPRSGCYKIDEYHPGGPNNWECTRYMPRNAKLDIEQDQSQVQSYIINQAENGAQWNAIGSQMFSSGKAAKLIMKNSPTEQCADSTCFWVADAFRLTWTGETCSATSGAPAALVAASSLGTQVIEHLGMLTLRAHLTDGHGHASDIALRLKTHQNVLETSLAAHFSFTSVQVRTIVAAGRRLGAEAGGSVNVHFVGKGSWHWAPGLEKALQKSMAVANSGLIITSAKVEWPSARDASADASRSAPNDSYQPILIISVCVALMGAALVAVLCLKAKARTNKTTMEQGQAAADELGKSVDQVDASANVIAFDSAKKEADDALEVVSLDSTRSPASDLPGVDDENNSREDVIGDVSQRTEEEACVGVLAL